MIVVMYGFIHSDRLEGRVLFDSKEKYAVESQIIDGFWKCCDCNDATGKVEAMAYSNY